MAAKTIAFINFKGGVGKTSNVVNIGACLAEFHHKKVLIVDLDPQCNSTFWLMRPKDFQPYAEAMPGDPILEKCSYQLFQDFLSNEPGGGIFNFEQACIKDVLSRDGLPIIKNLDLLPGGRALMLIDEKLCNQANAFKFTYLFDKLKHATWDYDFVLLDCPPNVFPITKNALFLADDIVVPFNPDFLSLSGFKFLCRILASIAGNYNMIGLVNNPRPISAFILNRAQPNANLFLEAKQTLLFALEQAQTEQLLSARCRLLEPAIRNSVEVGAAADAHLPVTKTRPNGIASSDYKALAADFLNHFSE